MCKSKFLHFLAKDKIDTKFLPQMLKVNLEVNIVIIILKIACAIKEN